MRILSMAAITLVIASVDSSGAEDYYVSPEGADSKPGSLERPSNHLGVHSWKSAKAPIARNSR